MTNDTFTRMLAKFGYTPHDAEELLGISRSAAFKYASGEAKVPAVVQLLLEMYERHGVPRQKARKPL